MLCVIAFLVRSSACLVYAFQITDSLRCAFHRISCTILHICVGRFYIHPGREKAKAEL